MCALPGWLVVPITKASVSWVNDALPETHGVLLGALA